MITRWRYKYSCWCTCRHTSLVAHWEMTEKITFFYDFFYVLFAEILEILPWILAMTTLYNIFLFAHPVCCLCSCLKQPDFVLKKIVFNPSMKCEVFLEGCSSVFAELIIKQLGERTAAPLSLSGLHVCVWTRNTESDLWRSSLLLACRLRFCQFCFLPE